jgi:hypothetical protein
MFARWCKLRTVVPGIFGICLSVAGSAALRASGAPEDWSWQKPHARVLDRGDLEWSPKPFVFETGASVRYIDYAGGNDDNAGTDKYSPWKHHPWDPEATGKAAACSGIHTYVVKRGVVYRGRLVARESGRPGDPIRLTSDPSWGQGEAVICGSERPGNWRRGADRTDIPDPDKVWWTDLSFAPRLVWMIESDGKITRIPLARTPNWEASDPDDVKSEWWHWDQNGVKWFDSTTPDGRYHLGVDSEHLTRPADYYQDALLWTEHGWVMGAPYPVRVHGVDTEKRGLTFEGRYGGLSYTLVKYNRYYLEDKPQYLDDPEGEFWFDKRGDGGRLYLRLPGDADPNSAHIEAARYANVIDSTSLSHVSITGLTFRFTNVHWDLDGVRYRQGEDLDTACIRLLGSGTDLRVANCLFEHVNTAVRMKALGRDDAIDQVVLSDNEVRVTDRGGFHILEGSPWGEVFRQTGLLYDVKILRNKLTLTGMRPTRFNLGDAVDVLNAQTVEVAGNVLDRLYSIGINVEGAKRGGSANDVPLTRILIHHNKVTNSLLSNDDFGGIETWQGGPAYVYDNISGNPGGYRNFWLLETPPRDPRFGHAYYLDGGFKNYHFNNIAWGQSKDPYNRLGNTAAFQEIISYQNTFFNNTVYNFITGTRRQAPQAGRDKFLGNVWQGIGGWLFWHSQPAETPEESNARDAGRRRQHCALETDAYAQNIFYDLASDRFGVLEPSGRWLEDIAAFQDTLERNHATASSVGEVADRAPLRDPAHLDFRLSAHSAAIDRGVKVFVPWGLYAMVGEWNFYPKGGDPTSIIDEHWYMTPYYLERDDYDERPTYPLQAVNVSADDYVQGALEDWTAGALRLNGKDQYATIPNAKLVAPFAYDIRYTEDDQPVTERRAAQAEELKNPQVHRSSFVIEAYFETEPGYAGGVLMEKMGAAGYSLAVDRNGRVAFSVKGAGGSGRVSSTAKVSDGRWHHVLAECDREGRTLTLYVDGKKDAQGAGIGPGVTLANDADLYVGGTPTGRCLAGTFDFLRIALGTLTDAKTTIEELHAWEFDGPFLRDFTGRAPTGGRRDAGALEKSS